MPASVVSVHETTQIGGSDGLRNEDYSRRRYWTVVISEPAANGGELALAASGIPAKGAAHPSLSGLYASKRSFESDSQINDGTVWNVIVEYAIPSSDSVGGSTIDPWNREERLSFGEARYEVAATVDAAGAQYKNTVGEALEVTQTKINPVLIYRVYRTRTNFSPFDVYPLVGTLNQGTFSVRGTTISAEKALLLRFSVADERWSDGTLLYDITYEIELESQFTLKTQRYQNKSFYHLVGGKPYRACDPAYDSESGQVLKKNGKTIYVPTATPVFLDDNGARIADPKTTDVSTYDIIRTKYATASWTNLDL
jgi:hypothetical protein